MAASWRILFHFEKYKIGFTGLPTIEDISKSKNLVSTV
jgi:hypothetical protein